MMKSICFEGFDHSGKSTLINAFKIYLESLGHKVEVFQEPSNFTRSLIFGESSFRYQSPLAKLFLFAADRSENVRLIREKIENSPESIILMDRFVWSTMAYQGFGERIPLQVVEEINKISSDDFMPDLVIYLRGQLPDADISDAYEEKGQKNPRWRDRVVNGYEYIFENFKETELLVLPCEMGIDQKIQVIWNKIQAS